MKDKRWMQVGERKTDLEEERGDDDARERKGNRTRGREDGEEERGGKYINDGG